MSSLSYPKVRISEQFALTIFQIRLSQILFVFYTHFRYFYCLQEQICNIKLTRFGQFNKIPNTHLNFIQSLIINSMNSKHIEELSPIKQNKMHEESQQTFEQSRPIIKCPQNSITNYQCMICNRLRTVCPFTKLTRCPHEGREKAVYKSDYFMEKSNMSTTAGQRIRIYSHQDALKQTQQSRQVYFNNAPPTVTHTHVNISPVDQVIYYPVIHNRYIVSPALQKSRNIGTPNREKRSRRVDYNDQIILTPTQMKEMMCYKQ